jgi:hypothetical protein
MDIEYRPQTLGEARRVTCSWPATGPRAGFTCAPVASGTKAAAATSLRHPVRSAPMTVRHVPTHNGNQFMERFTSEAKTLTGKPGFDQMCASFSIEHRSCLRHPQTNRMVECFDGCIADLVEPTRFASQAAPKTISRHCSA